jgi:hypothetical protein
MSYEIKAGDRIKFDTDGIFPGMATVISVAKKSVKCIQEFHGEEVEIRVKKTDIIKVY